MASTRSLCTHSDLQSHNISTDSWSGSEIEIEMALLKYFAPLKTFNVCVHKHMAHLWVWLLKN